MAPNKRSSINRRRSSSLKCLGCTSMPSGTISSTFEQPQFGIAFLDVFDQSMHTLFDKRVSTENIGVHNPPPIPCYNHDNRQAKLSTDSLRGDFDVRAQVITSISGDQISIITFFKERMPNTGRESPTDVRTSSCFEANSIHCFNQIL